MNWLIDNHPSYSGMERPQCAPQPIVLGGFEETRNNTDESDNEKIGEENRIDVEQMTFAARNEPSESTGPCHSEKDFIFNHMRGKNLLCCLKVVILLVVIQLICLIYFLWFFHMVGVV